MVIKIIINGQEALVKEGTSFDIVTENPMFTDAEAYSFNISFPLRGCPRNAHIFGALNRMGRTVSAKPLDMEIHAPGVTLRGVGVVNAVSDMEAKVQFLSGRSAVNYKCDLDDYRLPELDLGSIPARFRRAEDVTVREAWRGYESPAQAVAIPWVNENSGNIQNRARRDPATTVQPDAAPGTGCVWSPPEGMELREYGLSWMPFLIRVAERICDAIGFSHDFSRWEGSRWRYLIVCNAVPYTWDYNWATLMPDWSVLEFFRNLEPLIEGFFIFDMAARHIAFRPYAGCFSDDRTCVLEHVVDEFSSDVFEKEDECRFIASRFMGYEQRDSLVGKQYDCAWLIDSVRANGNGRTYFEYSTPEALQTTAMEQDWAHYAGHRRGSVGEGVTHIASVDRYVALKYSLQFEERTLTTPEGEQIVIDRKQYIKGVPAILNQFGPRNIPTEGDDEERFSPDERIAFVPAIIDDTDLNRLVFVPISSDYGRDEAEVQASDEYTEGDELPKTWAITRVEEGKKEKVAYFSNIQVAFYPGAEWCVRHDREAVVPVLDSFDLNVYFMPYYCPGYTLSLQDADGKFAGVPRPDVSRRYEISFLADSVPDVRSVFLIRGRRYLCEKVTATFSERGMSQKLKGTFWLIG